MKTTPNLPTLLTLPQFAARHQAFTLGQLRWMRFESTGDDPLGLGAAGAFVELKRPGKQRAGRVLVNEERFLRTLAERGGSAS